MELQADENDAQVTTDVQADDQQQAQQVTDETSSANEQADESDEVVVSIAGESPPLEEEEQASAPAWVKELRKTSRDLARENRELKQKLHTAATPKDDVTEVGKEPDLDDPDIDYDKDAFKAKWHAWNQRKQAHDAKQREQQDAAKKADEAWQATLDNYGKAKAALKVSDYDEAEAVVTELFSVTQRGLILDGAENSAVVLYALGKNPAKAKELAAITSPAKFAFAVAKLETQMKVTPRKAPPAPEKIPSGSASVSGSVDSKLAALEAEADRTGDRSKILAYKRQQRQAAA